MRTIVIKAMFLLAAAAGTWAQAPVPSSSLSPALPLRRDSSDVEARVGGAAWLLLAVAAAGAWAFVHIKRRRVQVDVQGKEQLRKLASLALTPHASLHVVEWNGKRLLVGCTSQGLVSLQEAEQAAKATQ